MTALMIAGVLTASVAGAAITGSGVDESWIGLQTDNIGATPSGIPYLTNIEPRPGQEHVPVDAVIRFDIVCDKEVDTNSIAITVDGVSATPELEQTEAGVSVEVTTEQGFTPESEVIVTVDACSVADEGGGFPWGDPSDDEEERCMETFSYSFFTEAPVNVPPRITIAGFGLSRLTEEQGGTLQILALTADDEDPSDVLSVRVYYDGLPTPILLHDDGRHGDFAANDNLFGCEIEVAAGFSKSAYLLQLRAFDRAGNPSEFWPYVTVAARAEAYARPPALPSYEEMMAVALFGDLGSENAARPQIHFGGYLDTDLDPASGGTFKLVAFADSPVGTMIASVELYAGSEPTGLLLQDNGAHGDFAAGDGVYGISLDIDTAIPSGSYLLSIVARDVMGRLSSPWPYVTIQ